MVWYFVKQQVADKHPKLNHKWTGLYQISQFLNEICLELESIADPSIRVITTVHYVTAYQELTHCTTPLSVQISW